MNLFATEGVFATVFVAGMVVFWPDVPWNGLLMVCLAAVLVTPVLIFPLTKMFYLAVDLSFRPPEPPDLATPIERGFVAPQPPGVSNRPS